MKCRSLTWRLRCDSSTSLAIGIIRDEGVFRRKRPKQPRNSSFKVWRESARQAEYHHAHRAPGDAEHPDKISTALLREPGAEAFAHGLGPRDAKFFVGHDAQLAACIAPEKKLHLP